MLTSRNHEIGMMDLVVSEDICMLIDLYGVLDLGWGVVVKEVFEDCWVMMKVMSCVLFVQTH